MPLLNSQTTQFLRYFMGAYPRRSASMIALLALAGLLEGIGVISMLPLLESIQGGGVDEGSRMSRGIGWIVGVLGVTPSVGVFLAMIVAAMTAKALFLWIAMRQVGYTIAQVTTDLRMTLLRSLMRVRWSYYASQPVGRLANAISSESHRAASAYREGCGILAGLLQMAAYLAVAVLVSWQMALAALLIGGLSLFLLRGFVRRSREAGADETELMRSLISRLTDALRGIKAVRAMGRENHLQPLLEEEAQGLNHALRREVSASETLRLFHEPVLTVVLATGLFFALVVADQPFPTVLLFAFIFYRLMANANTAQSRYQVVAVGESAFWSIMSQIRTAQTETEEISGRLAPPRLDEEIRFDAVRFRYGDIPILRGISLTIPAGQLTALYGPSGAGKTTCADLIVGLLRPESGEVTVDGVSLSEIDILAWRRGIGYVPQDSFLFHDTIFRNVTLGDATVGRDEVEGALRASGAWEFIGERPGGMDAIIGEGGGKLSGGQRQRISIARALLHRPRLLVLDECTASLDPATERDILATLETLRGEVTILAISHQPAVREAADVVYSLDHGVVKEVSRHHAAAATG